jgi:hypothetical protein
MKAFSIFKGSLLAVALLLATSAFAAEKGSLQVYDTVSVAGNQLPAGTYTVKWDGSGSAVQLSILKGKKVMATVPAQIVTLPSSSSQDSAVLNQNPDGSRTLTQVRFSGKNFALQIAEGASASAAGSSSK